MVVLLHQVLDFTIDREPVVIAGGFTAFARQPPTTRGANSFIRTSDGSEFDVEESIEEIASLTGAVRVP
jgi:hypothetical protein